MRDFGHENMRPEPDVGIDGGEGLPKRSGYPVDPHRVIKVVLHRREWLLGTAAMAVVLGGLIAKFVLKDTYEAYSIIVFEGLPEIPGMPSRGRFEFETLVNEVRLPENLRRVGKMLKIDAPVHQLFKLVEVEYAANTNLVNVSAQSASPEGAAAFANAVVDVYLDHRLKVEQVRVSEHLKNLDKDLGVAREGLREARQVYDAFRQQNGIADLSAETQSAIEAAADLQAQANLARAEAMAEEVRVKQLTEAQRTLGATTVLTERRNSPISDELSRARAELAQARSRLSAEHPRVQALEHQVEVLRSQSRQDTQSVTDRMVGLNPTYQAVRESAADSAANQQAAREREAALQALVEQARQRLTKLSQVEGEASKLLAQVQVATEHVNALEGQRAPVRDALRSPLSGFRVAERAVPPDMPLRSKKKLAVAAGVPFLAVLALLGLFLHQEFKGLRLVTAAEVAYWGRGPVIGSTVWPNNPEALQEFIAELDDFTPDVTGRTLVVGVIPSAIQLAGAVAEGLRQAFSPLSRLQTIGGAEEAFVPAGYLQGRTAPPLQAGSSAEDTVALDPENPELSLEGAKGNGQSSRVVTGEESTVAMEQPVDPVVEAHTVAMTHPEGGAGLTQGLGEPTAIVGAEDLPLFEVSVHAAVGPTPTVEAWDGPDSGPLLRRAARLADRVLVVVPSGAVSALTVQQVPSRLGRKRGIGYAVVDLEPRLAHLPDRSGEVDDFWFAYKD